ncbi:hypothetical protein [Lacinutrix sp.]|uniref:hypothetical protein n=1 Tax=Lacinutrix sp. TaxID=1937692 RepID=UPI0025C29FAE|nr:hypothetical protein [Lacinutrix sp.]
MGLFHYHDIGHAEIFAFDDFFVKQIKASVVITKEHNKVLKAFIKKHYNTRNVAYISNRIVSYSVDPLVYKEAEKIPSLVAIAVIPGDENMRANAEFERQFYDRPFGIFDNLTKAMKWAQTIINEENKK